MIYLSSSEINTLENYNFISSEFAATRGNLKNETLLCVKDNALTTVSSKDLTKWEFFKKLFGCGKLAGCELSLKSIAKYLEQKDLSNLEGSAYDKVHSIATRMLSHRKGASIPGLWKKLSIKERAFSVEHVTLYTGSGYKGNDFRVNSLSSANLYLTPKSTIWDLTNQVDLLNKHRGIYGRTKAQSVGGLAGRCETGYYTWYKTRDESMPTTDENLKDVFFKLVEGTEYKGTFYYPGAYYKYHQGRF